MVIRSCPLHQGLYIYLRNYLPTRLFKNKYVFVADSLTPTEGTVHTRRSPILEVSNGSQTTLLPQPSGSACFCSCRSLSAGCAEVQDIASPGLQEDGVCSDRDCVRRCNTRPEGSGPWTAVWGAPVPTSGPGWWQAGPSMSRALLTGRLGANGARPPVMRAPPARWESTQCTKEEREERGRRACLRRRPKPPKPPPKQPCPPLPMPVCRHGPPEPCAADPRYLMDPSCKTAIVTGGAGPIAMAAAGQLLAEGADRVLLADKKAREATRAVRALNKRYGQGKALFVHADVRNEGELECIFRSAVERFRRVQIVLNCVGVFDENSWEDTFDTNLKGVMRCCHLALRFMGADCGYQGGVVVNTAAASAWEVVPSMPAFCASKRAVIAATSCFGHRSVERRSKVRVLSLSPGPTRTGHVTFCPSRFPRPEWARETKRHVTAQRSLSQAPSAAGQALTYLVRYGLSGQHYVVEGNCIRHVNAPPRTECSRHVATFI